MTTLHLCDLNPEPASAGIARRFIRRAMAGSDKELLERIVLLTDELVTNGIQHAKTPLTLSLTHDRERLRVEVGDACTLPVEPREADHESTHGRGIAIVEALATSWGEDPRTPGKTVWFEIDRAQGWRAS